MADGEPAIAAPLTHAALRLRFKQRQQETGGVYQNWQIRVHRALSWMKRAEDLPADTQPEARFLFLWIALNSLYARWNARENLPDKDAAAREDFLREFCRMDGNAIGQFLRAHKPIIKKLLGDKFLWYLFWANPESPDVERRAKEDLFHLDGNLKKQDYFRVLVQLLYRAAVLRGQIVHGASTGGSKLNRESLSNAAELLGELIPLILHTVIEHGDHNDWPDLCYPPIDSK